MTINILIAVVTVLILFIAFFFIAKPQMENYEIKKQTEGVNYILETILQSVQTNGYIGIPVDENQTVNLVPVEACAEIVKAQAQQAAN